MREFFSLEGYCTPKPLEASLEMTKKSHRMSSMVVKTLLFEFLRISASIPSSLVSSFFVIVTLGLVSSLMNDS